MTQSNTEQIRQAMERMAQMPHLEAIAGLSELFEVQVDNSFSTGGQAPFKAAVFNMECGTRPERIMPYLQRHPDLYNLDIILANELDWGMARSGNRNVTEDIARALGMNYAYAVEFLSSRAWREGNREGRTGNAILSRYPLRNVSLLHLPIEYEWFYRENDCRLGTRIAIFAEVDVAGRRVGLVCLHLENRATPQQRARQLRAALSEARSRFGDIPVLVGGDMNTNTVDGDAPDGMDVFLHNEAEQARRMADIPSYEPLMACAEEFGYSYTDCNLMDKSTRRKPMPDGSHILLNLDWFFQRGLTCSRPLRVETVFSHTALIGAPQALRIYDGQELSDHDAVVVTCMP